MRSQRITFTIVNAETGENCPDCPYCGLYRIKNSNTDDDLSQYPVPEGHTLIEIERDEHEKLLEYHVNEETGQPEADNCIDLEVAERRVKERKKERKRFHMHGISYEDDVPKRAVKPRNGGKQNESPKHGRQR